MKRRGVGAALGGIGEDRAKGEPSRLKVKKGKENVDVENKKRKERRTKRKNRVEEIKCAAIDVSFCVLSYTQTVRKKQNLDI